MRTLLILILLLAAAVLTYLFITGENPLAGQEPDVTEELAPITDEQDQVAALDPVPLPRFDQVRVAPGGRAVLSGQAAPNAEVEILANGEVVATTTAIGNGDWARETDTPLALGPVELGLRMTTVEGLVITSEQTLIIYVPERAGDAPIVLRTTPGGATEILQSANADVSDLNSLSIDTIDYDAGGNVIFSGRAEPRSMVQVFADGQLVGQVAADETGRWELSQTVPPGRYILSIVQLDPEGNVVAEVRVPFEQVDLDNVVLEDGKVIVQPGNSLWVISRSVYNEGAQYTVIYAANANLIEDPDLIFPGQVFEIPEEDAGDDE